MECGGKAGRRTHTHEHCVHVQHKDTHTYTHTDGDLRSGSAKKSTACSWSNVSSRTYKVL